MVRLLSRVELTLKKRSNENIESLPAHRFSPELAGKSKASPTPRQG
jgi:hypothetical protein